MRVPWAHTRALALIAYKSILEYKCSMQTHIQYELGMKQSACEWAVQAGLSPHWKKYKRARETVSFRNWSRWSNTQPKKNAETEWKLTLNN